MPMHGQSALAFIQEKTVSGCPDRKSLIYLRFEELRV